MPKNPWSKRTLLAAAVALALSSPAVVQAAEPAGDAQDTSSAARIAELNEAGTRAYAERHYRAAIEKFVEAYAIDHDPNLLFNIARCYEKLGDLGAALEKYETFVAAPGADTQGRIKAKASIAELEELQKQGGVAPAGARAADAGSAEADPEASAETEASSPRILPWITLGTGVVVAGAGATLYALGLHDHAQVTDAAGYGDRTVVYPMTRSEAQAYVDAGNTKKLVGGIGMGVGGALIATGVVWLVTGTSEAAAKTAGSLTLAPSTSGCYAGYSGRF
ncbi:MAG TPA: hypothetical protein VGQ57_01050 [Polyangiaceae bacterium]|jgi:tetratricopeptide (TPR) repeat protein|nr:hypothetical protein [Polyangiaceae bacterium]